MRKSPNKIKGTKVQIKLDNKELGKYLNEMDLNSLIKRTRIIPEIRNSIMSEYNIDILDSGDTMSSIRTTEYIRSYDPSYNPNFHRNGVDAQSVTGNIEQKVTRVNLTTPTGLLKKNPYDATWTFHAVSEYEERYIFVAMDKKTWEPVRIYDISERDNVAAITSKLEEQKQAYLNGVKFKNKSAKNDRIGISEVFIRNTITSFTETTYRQCTIYRDINTIETHKNKS